MRKMRRKGRREREKRGSSVVGRETERKYNGRKEGRKGGMKEQVSRRKTKQGRKKRWKGGKRSL